MSSGHDKICAWYPPPANGMTVFLPALLLRPLALMPALGTPPASRSYKRHGLPFRTLTTCLLLHLLFDSGSPSAPTEPHQTWILPRTPLIMADSCVRPTPCGHNQPHAQHEVVAAGTTVPSDNRLKSLYDLDQHVEEQYDPASDVEEELPPYESVLVDTFVIDANEMWNFTCLSANQQCHSPEGCQSATGGLTLGVHHDFILFTSSAEWDTDQESSVVSCFTDDLSDSTQCTGSSHNEQCMQLSIPSLPPWKSSILKEYCQEKRRNEMRSNINVTKWLCKTGLDACSPQLGDRLLHDGPSLANMDEAKEYDTKGSAD
jgi:hypothetical protein